MVGTAETQVGSHDAALGGLAVESVYSRVSLHGLVCDALCTRGGLWTCSQKRDRTGLRGYAEAKVSRPKRWPGNEEPF